MGEGNLYKIFEVPSMVLKSGQSWNSSYESFVAKVRKNTANGVDNRIYGLCAHYTSIDDVKSMTKELLKIQFSSMI